MDNSENSKKINSSIEPGQQQNFLQVTKWDRFIFAIATILIPSALFFVYEYIELLQPEWQSGRISDYAGLILAWEVSQYFSPFLIYSMVCMGLLLISPNRFGKLFIVRFGIYAGTLLAVQYVIVLLFIPLAIVPLFVPGIFVSIFFFRIGAQWGSRWHKVFGWILAIGIGLSLIGNQFDLYIFPFGALSAGPSLCLATAFYVSNRLIRTYEIEAFNKTRFWMATIFWSTPFAVAWRLAAMRAIEEYEKLPLPPSKDCYIATAATKGHPAFVKSTLIRLRSGQKMRITPQLQFFRYAEIVFRMIFPSGHKFCRKIYDNLGRKLASKIKNPLMADLAYMSLKPFEWGTKRILKFLLPEYDELIS